MINKYNINFDLLNEAIDDISYIYLLEDLTPDQKKLAKQLAARGGNAEDIVKKVKSRDGQKMIELNKNTQQAINKFTAKKKVEAQAKNKEAEIINKGIVQKSGDAIINLFKKSPKLLAALGKLGAAPFRYAYEHGAGLLHLIGLGVPKDQAEKIIKAADKENAKINPELLKKRDERIKDGSLDAYRRKKGTANKPNVTTKINYSGAKAAADDQNKYMDYIGLENKQWIF